ncbi:MAG TPA: LysR family transcriptional regulator [bacterium]|nr:LysR family transcriptional regulator [bacterium]
METHQLRYFLAITQTGRFTAAAKACNVSQPSLSIQIAKLEDELGGPLFERTRKGGKLTARGETFLPRAKAILEQMESAREDAKALSGLSMGKVSLGCMPTTGAHLLPPILTAFRKSYPKIQVQLKEESSPDLAKDLEQGEVELAIMDEAGLIPGLAHETILVEELLLALPAKHRLAGKGPLALRQVAEEPFILMKSGHGFRQITLDFYRKAGLEPKVVFESGGIETVQALVAAGLGISLVPQMVAKFPGVAYAGISQPKAVRTLSLAWRKKAKLSTAAEALKKTIMRSL